MEHLYILENRDNGHRLIGHTDDFASFISKLESISAILPTPYRIVFHQSFASQSETLEQIEILKKLPYKAISRLIANSRPRPTASCLPLTNNTIKK